MDSSRPVPPWLWRIATWGFGVVVAGVLALAWGLSRGWADPPRAGPLLWRENFQADLSAWEFVTFNGAKLGPEAGALAAVFTAPDQFAIALAPGPAGDFTLEVAGAQTAGEVGAAYGLVFAWQDETHYSAVLVNGHGYAEAYQQQGAERIAWFEWQQWPNILLGTESNRVRLDVREGKVIARVNDEFLAAAATGAEGKIGLMARSTNPGRVVFRWAQVWASPP